MAAFEVQVAHGRTSTCVKVDAPDAPAAMAAATSYLNQLKPIAGATYTARSATFSGDTSGAVSSVDPVPPAAQPADSVLPVVTGSVSLVLDANARVTLRSLIAALQQAGVIKSGVT